MGRITAYDQNGRMVADFDKSGYDLMWMRQGYDDEIERLTDENAKLRELLVDSLMDVRAYAEKYGIEPLWATVDEHIAGRMRELGIEVGS